MAVHNSVPHLEFDAVCVAFVVMIMFIFNHRVGGIFSHCTHEVESLCVVMTCFLIQQLLALQLMHPSISHEFAHEASLMEQLFNIDL